MIHWQRNPMRHLLTCAAVAALAVGILAARRLFHEPRQRTTPAASSRRHTSRAAEPPAIPPWAATPDNTPDPGPGYIPAWKIDAPPPERIPRPPAAAPLRGPASPPRLNPGGVDGPRPPRLGT